MNAEALETFLSIGEVHRLPLADERSLDVLTARFIPASDLRNVKLDNIVVETLRMKLGSSLGIIGATAFTVGETIGDAVRKRETKDASIVLNISDNAIDQTHEGALKPSQVAFNITQTDDEIKACALCVFFPNGVRKAPVPAGENRILFLRKMGSVNFYATADLIDGEYLVKFMGIGDARND